MDLMFSFFAFFLFLICYFAGFLMGDLLLLCLHIP